MGLGSHKERMRGDFEDLHNGLIGGFSGKDQTGFLQLLDVTGVNFVTMSESHPDGRELAEEFRGDGAWF